MLFADDNYDKLKLVDLGESKLVGEGVRILFFLSASFVCERKKKQATKNRLFLA